MKDPFDDGIHAEELGTFLAAAEEMEEENAAVFEGALEDTCPDGGDLGGPEARDMWTASGLDDYLPPEEACGMATANPKPEKAKSAPRPEHVSRPKDTSADGRKQRREKNSRPKKKRHDHPRPDGGKAAPKNNNETGPGKNWKKWAVWTLIVFILTPASILKGIVYLTGMATLVVAGIAVTVFLMD